MTLKKEKLYLTDASPELAKQWHPTLNGDVTPDTVTPKSAFKAWWLFPYDDPETGKHFDFVWQAQVYNRAPDGSDCPYLHGKKVWPGYNDFASKYPDLASQWHPVKNGDLKPDQVPGAYSKDVWWYLPYDDPETGKHFDFEWQAKVFNRVKYDGCPVLSGNMIWKGYNDLAARYPDVAKMWHPTKNTKGPDEVFPKSNEVVWWYLPYDDPETGKHFDFEWQSEIGNQTRWKSCPYLTGERIWKGYNDLASRRPEIAAEWDYEANKKKPDEVLWSSGEDAFWITKAEDGNVFHWKMRINHRTVDGYGCPYLSNRQVSADYNSLAKKYPELAAEWDTEKNGCGPEDVGAGAAVNAWWKKDLVMPESGEVITVSWQVAVSDRVRHHLGCPYESGKAVQKGFNDLATVRPDIAAEWHPTKNGSDTPDMFTVSSGKTAWWYLHYYDEDKEQYFDFEWQSRIIDRTLHGECCPCLSGKMVMPGFNDLASNYPELAAQWHPTKNGDLTPEMVSMNSGRRVVWLLPYDDEQTGKHFDFEWESTVANRTTLGHGCPYLTNLYVWSGYNDLATRYPEIAKMWHPAKNGTKKPSDVTYVDKNYYDFYLPYDDPKTGKHFDFEWHDTVLGITKVKTPCPYLNNRRCWTGYNDLESKNPEIAAEWHPTKNGKRLPSKTMSSSTKKVWWLCPNGHEYKVSPASRTMRGTGCKYCSRQRIYDAYKQEQADNKVWFDNL